MRPSTTVLETGCSQDKAICTPQAIVIPRRGISREESASSLPAATRFLADTPGFEMTLGTILLCYPARII